MEELLKEFWCDGHGHGKGIEMDAKEDHRGGQRTVFVGGRTQDLGKRRGHQEH